MVPLFTLPATAGRAMGPGDLRSKYNLVLVFVDDAKEGEEYLRALAAINADVLAADARSMAVVPAPLQAATDLASRLALPFPLLADKGGSTTRRMLGPDKGSALCVADRFGQVYFLSADTHSAELTPAVTALDWLDFIQIQCPE
jgi:peroxiredoxin